MEERRRITTVRQLELLVEYLEAHKDLALGRVRSKEARSVASRLWREASVILNAEGPARTAKEWSKVWNDQKCKVRAKLVNINANNRGTGGGPNIAPTLTAIEEKIANILGRTVGPLPGVSQDQLGDIMVINEEVMQDIAAENVVGEIEVAEEPVNISPTINQEQSILSPSPSLTGQVPSPPPLTERRTIRGRRRSQLADRPRRERPSVSRTALEESRAMILEIETIKANASLKNAEALKCLGDSFKLIAESIDRMSRKFCQE